MNSEAFSTLLNTGRITSLANPQAPTSGKKIDLVFRTVGESTTVHALNLAIEHIKPNTIHIVGNIRPFSYAMQSILRIKHDCDYVVYADADCLILEDMRNFIESTDLPYIDCYVRDRYRGRIHCGVHITAAELVATMARIPEPVDNQAYVLRPESALRALALRELGRAKSYKNFAILHDYLQSPIHIFCKYALRELRSRTPLQRMRLTHAMQHWDSDLDFEIARTAIQHAATHVPEDMSPKEVDSYILDLPKTAKQVLSSMDIPLHKEFDSESIRLSLEDSKLELDDSVKPTKVFGLGLSRTGTRSLSSALEILGFDTVHYPIDAETLDTLSRGDGKFPLLDIYDGMTDITVCPYYKTLDNLYPGSKFILTVRDIDSWSQSCANHWEGRPAFEEGTEKNHLIHMEIRRFLRAAVYGSYDYSHMRFAAVYSDYVTSVLDYFKDRPGDLLVLNIAEGEGYEKLAPFLGMKIPQNSIFPHKGSKVTAMKKAALAAGLNQND